MIPFRFSFVLPPLHTSRNPAILPHLFAHNAGLAHDQIIVHDLVLGPVLDLVRGPGKLTVAGRANMVQHCQHE